MVYRQPVTVRYAETDQMGVVHHAAYLVYLEEARAGLLAAAGNPYKGFEEAGVGLPVRRVDVRYRSSARYGDDLAVSVEVIALRPASVTFEHRIVRVDDGAEILGAEVEMACFDMGTRRVKRFPERLNEIFRAAMPEAVRNAHLGGQDVGVEEPSTVIGAQQNGHGGESAPMTAEGALEDAETGTRR